MYLNLLKQIVIIIDIFLPLALLSYGYYFSNSILTLLGEVWYGINLGLTFYQLIRMWAHYYAIKSKILQLQTINITFHDLTDVVIPVDVIPVFYSKLFYYGIGIFSLIILIYTKNYWYLVIYIICASWFSDLINRFNKIVVKLNYEFQRCRELQKTLITTNQP